MQDRLLDTLPQFCQEDFGVGVLYDNTMKSPIAARGVLNCATPPAAIVVSNLELVQVPAQIMTKNMTSLASNVSMIHA
jgi:hypothetical protein